VKQRLKLVSQYLGDNLIRKVSKTDGSKLGLFKRIIYLGDKGQMSMVKLFEEKTIPEKVMDKKNDTDTDCFPISFEKKDQ
jgi:hypothetical protein